MFLEGDVEQCCLKWHVMTHLLESFLGQSVTLLNRFVYIVLITIADEKLFKMYFGEDKAI